MKLTSLTYLFELGKQDKKKYRIVVRCLCGMQYRIGPMGLMEYFAYSLKDRYFKNYYFHFKQNNVWTLLDYNSHEKRLIMVIS